VQLRSDLSIDKSIMDSMKKTCINSKKYLGQSSKVSLEQLLSKTQIVAILGTGKIPSQFEHRNVCKVKPVYKILNHLHIKVSMRS
jgi:hypothetical protein